MYTFKNNLNAGVPNHKLRAVSGSSGQYIMTENSQQQTVNQQKNNTSAQILTSMQYKATRSVSSKKNTNLHTLDKKSHKLGKNVQPQLKYTSVIQNNNIKSLLKNQKNLGI